MVFIYRCPICEYTAKMSDFKRHLEKKKQCKSETITLDVNNLEKYRIIVKYKCNICDQKYTRKGNLDTHLENIHDIFDNKEKHITEQEYKPRAKRTKVNKNTNNTNTNNTANTNNTTNINNGNIININTIINAVPNQADFDAKIKLLIKQKQIKNFDDTFYNQFNDEQMFKYLKNCEKGAIDYINDIHFNPDFPKYMNFYVGDVNRNTLYFYNGQDWQRHTKKADEFIKELIVNIINHIYYWAKNLDDKDKNNLNNFDKIFSNFNNNLKINENTRTSTVNTDKYTLKNMSDTMFNVANSKKHTVKENSKRIKLEIEESIKILQNKNIPIPITN